MVMAMIPFGKTVTDLDGCHRLDNGIRMRSLACKSSGNGCSKSIREILSARSLA